MVRTTHERIVISSIKFILPPHNAITDPGARNIAMINMIKKPIFSVKYFAKTLLFDCELVTIEVEKFVERNCFFTPKKSTNNPKVIPIIAPTTFTTTNAFKLEATSASAEAPSKTNEPSPKVVINAANKPPNVIFLFLYKDEATIVPPQPGITPKKAPRNG